MNVGDLVELSAVGKVLLSYKKLHTARGLILEYKQKQSAFKVQWFGEYNRTIMMWLKRQHLKKVKVRRKRKECDDKL